MEKDTEKKHIIKNIVWKSLEDLKFGKDQYIEFKWGRKRFIIKRKK